MAKSDLRKDLERACDEVERRNSGPYDGVLMGALPAWIPPILADEFTSARFNLLKKFSEIEIRQFLTEQSEIYAEALARDPRGGTNLADLARWVAVPFECWPDLSTVRLTNSIFALGEARGIRAWVGEKANAILESAARKKVASSGGKHDRPKALKNLIAEMIRENPQIKPADVRANLAELSAKQNSIIKKFDGAAGIYEWMDENDRLQRSQCTGIPDLLAKARISLK